MRILIVSSTYWPYPLGGSEHVHYLCRGLKERGHEITLLTTNYPWLKHSADTGHIDDVEIIRVGRAYMIQINKSVSVLPIGIDIPFKVKAVLTKKKYDIVHTHGCYPPEIGFWTLLFSKSVNCVTYHTVGFNRSYFYNLAGKVFRPFAKKIHGHIAVSEVARSWAEPYMPGDYRIIPNGIDTNRFNLSIPAIDRPKDAFIILYLGRLDMRKGIFVALEAFSKIKDKFPHALLYVVGKGVVEEEAKAYAEKLQLSERCQFFGYINREDLARFYRACDVYVAPALGGEAQGIVLLEAMACGKPVIVSNIAGYQEVVQNNEYGMLFDVGSSEDLANKIGLLIADKKLQEKLAIKARQRAEYYAWPKIVERVENYYIELIARHKSEF